MKEAVSLKNDLYGKIFYTTWPKWLGGVLLAFLNIGLFLYLMPLFGVYPAMADWGIWTFKLVGLDIPTPWGSTLELPHLSSRSMVNFGLLFGALIGALLSREFMIRRATIGAYTQSAAGGALMGIGSFMVGSCIIGGFYSSIMALSLSGFYMMLGLLAGAYIGGKFLIWQKSKGPVFNEVDAPAKSNPRSYLPKVGVVMTIVLIGIAAAYFMNNRDVLGGVILFSAAFGLVFQRSSFGFATAFRDVFTTRNNETMRGVMISLIIGVIGFSIIKANGIKPAQMFVSPAGWHTVIGGLIFGFGMVLADGWVVGILRRSAEGHIKHWFAVLGAMLAGVLWVPLYGQKVGHGWLYGKGVFMPDRFGWPVAVAGTLFSLVLFYIFVTWIERKSKAIA